METRGLSASVRQRNEPSAEATQTLTVYRRTTRREEKNTLGGQNTSRDEVVRRQDVNIASFPASAGYKVEVKVNGKATGEILSEMESRRKS